MTIEIISPQQQVLDHTLRLTEVAKLQADLNQLDEERFKQIEAMLKEQQKLIDKIFGYLDLDKEPK